MQIVYLQDSYMLDRRQVSVPTGKEHGEGICVERIMAPQISPHPKPKFSEYVTLYGKRNVARVIKLRILKRGDYPRLSGWTQSNHKDSYKRKKSQS